ncbi:hypothetical protein, partial [Nocardioides jensenii]|uniref:hypothetical protein n=1 Tax=Nocardioides jensenii TaxID=1843 RepID=UPI000ACF8C2A
RRAVGGAVLAAAVVAAIPLGLTLVNHDDPDTSARENGSAVTDPSDGTSVEDPAADLPAIPDGWRWESWRNVEVAVPGDWRDGSAYDLCIPGAPNPPAGNVARDGYQADFEPDVADQASCPQGVTFLAGEPKEALVAGDGVGERVSLGGNTIDVVAGDQKTLDQIVDSAHEITATDSLGCAATIEFGKADFGEAEGEVTMCEYVIGGYRSDRTTPVLDSSRVLADDPSANITSILAGTVALPNADQVELGCTLPKGAPEMTVRRILVDGVALADLASEKCGGAQLVTDAGPTRIDYALLDAFDPATMSLG